jgi:dienelactone hydrolase
MRSVAPCERVACGSPANTGLLCSPARPHALVVAFQGAAEPLAPQVTEVLNRHGLAVLMLQPHGCSRQGVGAADAEDLGITQLLQTLAAINHGQVRGLGLGARPVGLLGTGDGAAVALLAAAAQPGHVAAVVCCSGHPDEAGDALAQVAAPVLLVAAGEDGDSVPHHRSAFRRLAGRKRLELVPQATGHFTEPGALQGMAELAAMWFDSTLGRATRFAG